MGRPTPPQAATLVGRSRELETLTRLIDQAVAGEAQTGLVLGAAGVGKTTLVRSACASREATLVIRGACLPLVSASVPFLGLRMSVRGVRAELNPPDIDAFSDRTSEIMFAFDAWITSVSKMRPVVLIMDDLQWADAGTLDVLTYLVAGPTRRRLAILGTVRREEAGPRGVLPRWLADVRRQPRVTELPLDPLGRDATGEQVAHLLGELPHHSLVDDVHRRTRGNPYLTALLVADIPPQARTVPRELASDLRSALLASWTAAPSRMRQLAEILAVGAAPMRAEALAGIAGYPVEETAEILDEAIARGLLESAPDGAVWHPHPLNAEVLVGALTMSERARLHGAFADALQARDDAGSAAVAARIADHREEAGDAALALRWALQAASAAEQAGAHAEAMRPLRVACRMSDSDPDRHPSLTAILLRLRAAAAHAGAHEQELETVEQLLTRVSPEEDPLLVAELLVRRMHLEFSTGRAFLDPAAAAAALRTASADALSGTYAFVLAEVAHSGLWAADPAAPGHAARAVAIARGARDDRALAYALAAGAMAAVILEDGEAARYLAEEGADAALRAQDWWGYVHASLWEGNARETWASREYAELMRARREHLVALRAPHAYIGWLAASEAMSWFTAGQWEDCRRCLRDAFSSDPGPLADAQCRLAAARLAVWQGRQHEAEQHLARADELVEASSDFLPFDFDAVRAEVRLGAHDWTGAFDAAMVGATSAGVPPTMCEWLLPLAARALADSAEAARDVGEDVGPSIAAMGDLFARFPEIIRDFGNSTPLIERQMGGLTALYGAERARCVDPATSAESWRLAADALDAAELPWEATYARSREADVLLVHVHDRIGGASALRVALNHAERLQAAPLVLRLRRLAHHARISVRDAATPEAFPHTGALENMTPREREVLALVVAGLTYAEIARELVISEKTVSTHISHLLTKTGTDNRLELAALAERMLTRRE